MVSFYLRSFLLLWGISLGLLYYLHWFEYLTHNCIPSLGSSCNDNLVWNISSLCSYDISSTFKVTCYKPPYVFSYILTRHRRSPLRRPMWYDGIITRAVHSGPDIGVI